MAMRAASRRLVRGSPVRNAAPRTAHYPTSCLLSFSRAQSSLQAHSRTFITAAGYNLAKKMMPKMSETEKIALGAGTVGFDRDIFGGSPSLKHLVDTYTPKLSAEEQAFLDNEVEELCRLLDDHQVTTEKDMSPEAWDYMRYAPPPSHRARAPSPCAH